MSPMPGDSPEHHAEIARALGILLWEAERTTGRITFLSDSVTEVTGYRRDQWATLESVAPCIAPEDRGRRAAAIDGLQPGENRWLEYRLTTVDGRSIRIEEQLRLDPRETGDLVRGIARDITERRPDTHRVESGPRLAELVESVPVGVYTLRSRAGDETLRFDYLNHRMGDLLGRHHAAAARDAEAILAGLLPEDRPGLRAATREAARSGQPFEFEGRFRVGDEIRWLRLSSTPVTLPDGGCLWHGVALDITAGKAVEIAGQELQAELELILDAMPVHIWYKDTANRMLRVNARVAASLGRPKSAIEGRSTAELYPLEAARYYRDDLELIRTGRSRLGILEPMTLPGGEQRWVRTDKLPLKDSLGRITRLLVTSTDVTDLQRATKTLRQEIEARRQRELDLKRLGRLYATLSQINQTLLRGQTRDQIFREFCRIQVETGQVAMAWVGWIDADTRKVVPIAAWGDESGYLDSIGIGIDPGPEGGGPTSRAIRENRPILCEDFVNEPGMRPWRDALIKAGWVCAATFPIHLHGEPRGAFSLHGREAHTFGSQEMALIQQAAANISFALDALDLKRQRREAGHRLTQAAQSYNRLLQATKEAFWLVDAGNGRLLDVNDAASALTGYSRDELLRLRIPDLDPDIDEATFMARARQVIQSGGALFQARLATRSGRHIEVEVSITPDLSSNTLISFIRDITDRKLAESRLQASQASLAKAQEVAQLGSWVLHVDDNSLEWSAQTYRIFGIAEGTPMTYDGFLTRVHPEDRERIELAWQAALRGAPYRIDHRILIDGREKWVREQAEFSPDPRGMFRSAIGTVIDITSLKVAEQRIRELNTELEGRVERRTAELLARTRELQQSEERFRLAMEATSDGLWDWDLPTGQVYYSPGYARLLGYEPEELRPRIDTWLSLTHPDDRDEALARQTRLQTQPGHFDMEFRMRARGGHYVWVLSRGRTVTRDDTGNPVRVVGTIVDQTERKTSVMALRDSEQRYRQLSNTLEQKVDERTRQLADALAAKGQFLANMSHEIRTPMNAVLGLAQLLERELLAPGQATMVRHIREAGDSLLHIINDILDLSKIEAGQFELEQAPLDLPELLDRPVHLFHASAREKGIAFGSRMEGDMPDRLLGDALRLGQVITNLCGNAVKFTERGSVELVARALEAGDTEARLRFEIRDTGIGVSAESLNALFRPFTQADGSITRRFGGTGLGLAISKRLAELMGGAIGASSAPGRGSTFWVEIPLARSASPHVPVRNTPPVPPGGQGRRLARLRVLVVDDNATNRFLVEQALEREGAITSMAMDGRQALDMLLAEPDRFDVVLMDIQMPVMDGLSATRSLRADPRLAAVPVIAFTAGVMSEERQAALHAGVSGFLAKPVDLDSMTALLARYRPPAADTPTHLADPSKSEQENTTMIMEPLMPPTAGARAPIGLADLPGVNLAPVLELLGGDRELLGQLLGEFLAEFEGVTEQAENALRSGATAELITQMHTLKGTAANLGLLELSQRAAAMESAVKQGEGSEEALTALRLCMDAQLPAIREAATPAA